MKIIRCQSPLHDTRADIEDGRHYSDDLGTYDGWAPPPMVCTRCAHWDAVIAGLVDDDTGANDAPPGDEGA
jgi:hypothetical protein